MPKSSAKRRLVFTTPYSKRRRVTPAKARSIIRKAARGFIKRKRYAKRRYGGYGRTQIVMYDKLLQHKLRTRLTFCDTKTISPSTSAAYQVYRLASIYDPDFTGVGHQPAFHDQWAALYKHYRVIGVKWSVLFAPKRGAKYFTTGIGGTEISDSSHHDQTHNPGIVCFQVSNISGGTGRQQIEAADLNFLRETGRFRGKDGTVGYKMTSASPTRTYRFKGWTSIKQMVDDPEEYNQANDFGAAAIQQAYLHLGCISKDGGTMADYRVDVRLEYLVELTELEANIGAS